MYEPARHVPLSPDPCDPAAIDVAVREIVEDALAQFDPEYFWPAHPLDDGVADGVTTLYFGAAGAIWALDRLHAGRDVHGRALWQDVISPGAPGQAPARQRAQAMSGTGW